MCVLGCKITQKYSISKMSAKLWGQCLVPVERGRRNGRCRDKACLVRETWKVEGGAGDVGTRRALSALSATSTTVLSACVSSAMYYCLVSLCLVSSSACDSPSAINILPLFLCRLEQINYFCD